MNTINTDAIATKMGSVERAGWSIEEWCARWSVRRGLYYKMEDKPLAISIGTRKIITVESDREWGERQIAKAKAANAAA
jgi:hypothetical protein